MLLRTAAILLIVLMGWAYQAIRPPPPKICGSPNGPPITAPRIQLRDGRHLAYKEAGTPKEKARYKVIIAHALHGSRESELPASQELVDKLGIYFLSFDRAGYGESDPNPKRSVKSEVMDMEELADQLEIGAKFYAIGISMGGYSIWGCLQYIPSRLAGAALIVPVTNYWWPSIPATISKAAFSKIAAPDLWTFWIAHRFPSLLHWWMTQTWFPSLGKHPDAYSKQDLQIMHKFLASPRFIEMQIKASQQGAYESVHRDLMVGFGNWEFDPTNISNPFPHNEGSVHIWQGYDDGIVRVEVQRYISEKLPWIQYHEIPEGGHLFMFDDGWTDTILKALLLGEEH